MNFYRIRRQERKLWALLWSRSKTCWGFHVPMPGDLVRYGTIFLK